MSTTPPEQGGPGGPNIPMGQTLGSPGSIARLPMAGNAEFAVFLIVELIFALIWIIADSVNTQQWVLYTTVLTAFYMLSRGIAKASRVLEA
jgi:hypothetical protein